MVYTKCAGKSCSRYEQRECKLGFAGRVDCSYYRYLTSESVWVFGIFVLVVFALGAFNNLSLLEAIALLTLLYPMVLGGFRYYLKNHNYCFLCERGFLTEKELIEHRIIKHKFIEDGELNNDESGEE
jgi:hypothetical protein